MNKAVVIRQSKDKKHGVKFLFDRHYDLYAIDSEVNNALTYVERDGEFALCYGTMVVQMRKDVWQELAEVLNHINWTKYGRKP